MLLSSQPIELVLNRHIDTLPSHLERQTEMCMKKVLVIGSNSFSGSDFIDLLLQEGKYQVIGVSRSREKEDLFLPYKRFEEAPFEFHQIDLNEQFEAFEQLVQEKKPQYIVNFAAQSEVAPSWQYPVDFFRTNALTITRLAEFLRKLPFLEKYVHISSPEIYGNFDEIIDETAPMNPSTPYAASKAAGDLSLQTFYRNYNLPVVFIRATNVYGKHQQLHKIIPRSVIYFSTGKKIQLHGGGKAVKSYIHIRDVSQGELLAMEKGRPGEVYHFSPNEGGISIRSLVEKICEKMDQSFDEWTEIVAERPGQDKAYVIDSSKARNELGWKPGITLDEGLEGVVKWIGENLDEVMAQPLEYVHQH